MTEVVPIRVLITDDHAIVRHGLRLILETTEHIEVVGEAADGKAALSVTAATEPDVVLMDLRMPEMDGLEAIRHLKREQPDVAVIILTTYNEDELMVRGLRAGARGYLLKDTDRQTLIATIEAAARGETLLKPEVLARVLAFRESPSTAAQAGTTLTERELEVLRAGRRFEQALHNGRFALRPWQTPDAVELVKVEDGRWLAFEPPCVLVVD